MIYTSYYAKPALRGDLYCKISISLYKPRFNKIDFHFKTLAPTKQMLDLDLCNDSEFEKYNAQYQEILSKLNPSEIQKAILDMAGNKIPVLLCYEKDHETCHRWDVAEWFTKNGIQCIELS